tara:strand:+ start:542 stop:1027 length:486 start_codon:yes stop_codon:yes gene_type:complete
MDYSVSRPLIVEGTVRGAYRFDIIRPATWDNLPNGNSPEWYSDELLVVRNIASAEVVFSRSLKSGTVEFLVDGLSNNYIVFTEWSGGSSCCLLVSAFEVTENFKVLLDRHNNDFFDKTTIIINGTDRLQLHRDLVQDPDQPHSMLKNQPSVFDLKMGKWKK